MDLHKFAMMGVVACLILGGCGEKSKELVANLSTNEGREPSLVTRMYDAMDAEAARRFNTGTLDRLELVALAKAGYTNAAEIATRSKGKMAFCDDGISNDERKKLWPFDLREFEKTIESRLVVDTNGCYRLKEKSDDGSAELMPVNPTIRWVNHEIEEWATKELDAKCKRVATNKLAEILGGVPNNLQGLWMVSEGGYLAIERQDGAWDPRTYTLFDWKSGGEGSVLFSFNSFPMRFEAVQCIRMMDMSLENEEKARVANNLAVLEWQHRVNRFDMNCSVISDELEFASSHGVAEATLNLTVLTAHFQGALREEQICPLPACRKGSAEHNQLILRHIVNSAIQLW